MNNTETKQAAELLRSHNKWRRGDESIEMHNPEDIGKAIDIVLDAVADRDSRLAAIQEDRDQETSRILAISCPGHADLLAQLAAAQRSAEDARARLADALKYANQADEMLLQVANGQITPGKMKLLPFKKMIEFIQAYAAMSATAEAPASSAGRSKE